jgi:hypothetical protein
MTTDERGFFKVLIVIILLVIICITAGVFFFNKAKPTVSLQSRPQVEDTTEPTKAKVVYGSLNGKWAGPWTNSLGEHGTDTLDITDTATGFFQGVWAGNINITGQWLTKDSLKFSGQTETRDYQVQGSLQGDTLILNYTATRLNTSGTYTGEENLTRISK